MNSYVHFARQFAGTYAAKSSLICWVCPVEIFVSHFDYRLPKGVWLDQREIWYVDQILEFYFHGL